MNSSWPYRPGRNGATTISVPINFFPVQTRSFFDLCGMHPKYLSIEDFTYELPDEKIALHPAHPRDSSRLLIFSKGEISADVYRNITDHLPARSTLVFNDTRVIKARLLFKKETGAVIEIFCLEPATVYQDYDRLFQETGSSIWKCMIGKAGKWKEKILKKEIMVEGRQVELSAGLVKRLPDSYLVKLTWTPSEISFNEIINAAGTTPLPPYIKRSADKGDEEDYQTIFSAHEGSVAAPTAGLHFSSHILQSLEQRGIPTLFTTLHVGAGTFRPVKSSRMEGHAMHAEWMNITRDFLRDLLKQCDRTIVAVGTTATRTLESIYWMGNKLINNPRTGLADLKIKQWEVYEEQPVHSRQDCITALLSFLEHAELTHLMIETEIIIAPPYNFRLVDALITNFHQPRSTLLLLVAALAGDEWKNIYAYALSHDFRFLSYGDGCLIIP